MRITTIAVLGGTGFVGTHLVNRLTMAGYRLRVLTRRRERHRHLLVIPTLQLIESDIHNPAELRRQLTGCEAVVNLVGILNERGDDGSGFRHAHVDLAQTVVAACKTKGVRRLLHMSALNADAHSGASHYLKTKGEAEDLVHEAAEERFLVTSFRPSVIFGPEDRLFNRFGSLLRLAPYYFPLACAQARFAPVYVGDVAEALVRSLTDRASPPGQRYELCGPREYSLQQLVEYTAKVLGLRRRVIALGEAMSRRQAQWLEHLPDKLLSLDNYRSLQIDSVCKGGNGLAALGITPLGVEAVVPEYLEKRYQRGRYWRFRAHARRS